MGNYWGSKDAFFENWEGGKIVYKPWLKEDESLSWGTRSVESARKVITTWGKIKK